MDNTQSIKQDIGKIAVAILATVFVVAVAIVGGGAFYGTGQSTDPSAQVSPNLATWYAMLVFQALMIGSILVIAWFFGKLERVLSLAWQPDAARTARQPFLVSTAILAAFSIVTMTVFPEATGHDIAIFSRLLVDVPLWLPLLVLSVGAPLSEELVFRGFLLGRLRETRLGFPIAAIIATAGWTLLHLSYSFTGLINVFLAGLLFSWSLWRTGTLWVPIAFHALYNAIVLVVIRTLYMAPA